MEFGEGRVDKERFFEGKKLRKEVHLDVDWWVSSAVHVGKEVEKVLEGMYIALMEKISQGYSERCF